MVKNVKNATSSDKQTFGLPHNRLVKNQLTFYSNTTITYHNNETSNLAEIPICDSLMNIYPTSGTSVEALEERIEKAYQQKYSLLEVKPV